MSNRTVYLDPTSENWPHPNLVAGLMSSPAKEGYNPLESQLTTVLAWLLDRSPHLFRAFARLFVKEDREAVLALEKPGLATGARAWLTLQVGDGPILRPDLDLAIEKRAFELIVELKAGASFHSHTIGDHTTEQP